jgi:Uma2 family endonuclease
MGEGLKRVLDFSDYLVAPEDGNRYEIIRGKLFVTPSPTAFHQRVSRRLVRLLGDHFHPSRQGEVFHAPVTLRLTDHDVVEPDILVIECADQIDDRGIIQGPPLLVVEILSPSTASRDRTVKARRYAEVGIRHYWLVDPETRRIECYVLESNEYRAILDETGEGRHAHPELDGLILDLTHLWSESEAPRR